MERVTKICQNYKDVTTQARKPFREGKTIESIQEKSKGSKEIRSAAQGIYRAQIQKHISRICRVI